MKITKAETVRKTNIPLTSLDRMIKKYPRLEYYLKLGVFAENTFNVDVIKKTTGKKE